MKTSKLFILFCFQSNLAQFSPNFTFFTTIYSFSYHLKMIIYRFLNMLWILTFCEHYYTGLSHSFKCIDQGIGLMARFFQDSLKIWDYAFWWRHHSNQSQWRLIQWGRKEKEPRNRDKKPHSKLWKNCLKCSCFVFLVENKCIYLIYVRYIVSKMIFYYG